LCCPCARTSIDLWSSFWTRGTVRSSVRTVTLLSCFPRIARLCQCSPPPLVSYLFSAGLYTASVLVTLAGSYNLNVQLAIPGGLNAAYYDISWPSTSPAMERIDSSIGLTSDLDDSYSGYSSVRWSGRLSSSFSGLHTFYVSSKSGTRFWIDGVLLLDRWASESNLTATTFTLQASALHAIQFDAKLPATPSAIQLQWASSAFLRQSVPSHQLFSTAHVAGSPFDLLVAPAPACASKSTAVLRGTSR
jgi:hypothetical protein